MTFPVPRVRRRSTRISLAEAIGQRIILIDGKKLASLMIEHDVGVAQLKKYTVRRLDQDYFDLKAELS